MTLEIDENYLARHLDGIKKMADSNNSIHNVYKDVYNNYLKAYNVIGLYVTFNKNGHIVKKSSEL